MSNTKAAIRKEETIAERYILFDSLLFKVMTTPEKETALLAIPDIFVDKIISLCYSSFIFEADKSVIKTYFTRGDIFFIPGLIHHLRSYIKGCYENYK